MLRVAIPAWYIAMWVNAPLPVTSPMAQTPGATRQCSSIGSHLAPLVTPGTPKASTPSRSSAVCRPVATRSRSAVTGSVPFRCTAKPSAGEYPIFVAPVPTRSSIPSSASAVATSSLASGSSSATSRSSASITVTSTPNLANTWPSSTPIEPPPRMASERGSVSTSIACRLVQYGVPARPSIGGTAGSVPVASTSARLAVYSSPPTATERGPVTFAQPRTNVPPLPSSRSTATRSFQLSVASARIRCATGAQSGVTSLAPAMPGMRRASASRLAARTIILLGTQPQYGHSPPTRLPSMPATDIPASASFPTRSSPPGPSPTTSASKVWVVIGCLSSPSGCGYTSTQLNVRSTALRHAAYPSVRCRADHVGVQRRSSFQCARSSSTERQKPAPRPAAYAAPNAVVSATTGRQTGTPRMSACSCMHNALAVTPPSTLSRSSVTPESAVIASTTSRVW